MRTTFAVLVCALLLPGVAVAQSDTRSYVMGNGGVTFGTETAPMVGAQFGTSLGSSLQLYAGGGYYDNVLPGGVQTDLDQAAEALTTVTGLPWEFDAKARAFCVSGGARYLFDTGSAMRPYVSAGAGFANLKVRVSEVDLGDITEDFVEAGLDDATTTKPLVEFGGGVAVPIGGHLYLDAGYKFIKIIDADGANISRAMVGFGARF
jgi:opacity protein-like surface antigen